MMLIFLIEVLNWRVRNIAVLCRYKAEYCFVCPGNFFQTIFFANNEDSIQIRSLFLIYKCTKSVQRNNVKSKDFMVLIPFLRLLNLIKIIKAFQST